MKKLTKNLRKYFFIEPKVVDYVAGTIGDEKKLVPVVEYTVWHGRYMSIPFGRKRITVIYGLDFTIFSDPIRATDHMLMQKRLYKHAVVSRYKK